MILPEPRSSWWTVALSKGRRAACLWYHQWISHLLIVGDTWASGQTVIIKLIKFICLCGKLRNHLPYFKPLWFLLDIKYINRTLWGEPCRDTTVGSLVIFYRITFLSLPNVLTLTTTKEPCVMVSLQSTSEAVYHSNINSSVVILCRNSFYNNKYRSTSNSAVLGCCDVCKLAGSVLKVYFNWKNNHKFEQRSYFFGNLIYGLKCCWSISDVTLPRSVW